MQRERREFQAQLMSWKQIHALPGGWPPSRLQFLLTRMELDGVPDDEVLDMVVLALQDREADEAAELVLEAVFRESMRPGLRQNLSHELDSERPWEEFADISCQAGIFNAVVLLHLAFPREYDEPDAVSAAVRLSTASERARSWLSAASPDLALLVRILAGGMDDRAALRRLFDESIGGRRFEEARSILWHASRNQGPDDSFEFTLISGHQWFDPLKKLDGWTATAWPDAPAISSA